jgi:hypothetical protein
MKAHGFKINRPCNQRINLNLFPTAVSQQFTAGLEKIENGKKISGKIQK